MDTMEEEFRFEDKKRSSTSPTDGEPPQKRQKLSTENSKPGLSSPKKSKTAPDSPWTAEHTTKMVHALLVLLSTFERVLDRLTKLEKVNNLTDPPKTLDNFKKFVDKEGKRITNKEFKVSVTALLKCGKSTLLNCFLRGAFLPEDVLPATSAVVTLKNDPKCNLAILRFKEDVLAKGEEATFEYLKTLNTYFRELGKDPNHKDKRFSPDMCTSLKLSTPIEGLVKHTQGDAPVKFLFLDTPGANEANATIDATTSSLLQTADVAIYLFDVSKLGQLDEQNYINRLHAERPDLMTANPPRVFFVLNKIDLIAPTLRESKIAEAKKSLYDFLAKIDPELANIMYSENCLEVSTGDFLAAYLAKTTNSTMKTILRRQEKFVVEDTIQKVLNFKKVMTKTLMQPSKVHDFWKLKPKFMKVLQLMHQNCFQNL